MYAAMLMQQEKTNVLLEQQNGLLERQNGLLELLAGKCGASLAVSRQMSMRCNHL